jgi:hypothetical protein
MKSSLPWAFAVLLLSCADVLPATAIKVGVSADERVQEQLGTVVVMRLDEQGRERSRESFDQAQPEQRLPFSLGVPSEPGMTLRLAVRGYAKGADLGTAAPRIERKVIARFRDRQTLWLPVRLGVECFDGPRCEGLEACALREDPNATPGSCALAPTQADLMAITPESEGIYPEVLRVPEDDGIILPDLDASAPRDASQPPPANKTPEPEAPRDAAMEMPLVNYECGPDDNQCPTHCAYPQDPNCRRPLGDACTEGTQCADGGHCVAGVCCNDVCDGPCEQCTTGTCVPRTVFADITSCGRCQRACSREHISGDPWCREGVCGGTCVAPYQDCNGESANDGCESDRTSDARNCGRCAELCPYNVCAAGSCAGELHGYVDGEERVSIPPNTLVGVQRFTSSQPTMLVGIGVHLPTSELTREVRFKLGVYSNDEDDLPRELVRQTDELTPRSAVDGQPRTASQFGGVEGLVAPVRLEPDSYYWIFAFASDSLTTTALDEPEFWTQNAMVGAYESVDELPQLPGPFSLSSAKPTCSLYFITVPL